MKPVRLPVALGLPVKREDLCVHPAEIEFGFEFGVDQIVQRGPIQTEQPKWEIAVDVGNRDLESALLVEGDGSRAGFRLDPVLDIALHGGRMPLTGGRSLKGAFEHTVRCRAGAQQEGVEHVERANVYVRAERPAAACRQVQTPPSYSPHTVCALNETSPEIRRGVGYLCLDRNN